MGISTAWRSMGRTDGAYGSEEGISHPTMVIDQGSAEPVQAAGPVNSGWLPIGVFPVIMAVPFGVVAWLLA